VAFRKVHKNNINHQTIKLLLSYWLTRRGYEKMLINRSAHVLNKWAILVSRLADRSKPKKTWHIIIIKRAGRLSTSSEAARRDRRRALMKIFISSEWIYPVAKRTENNKLTNLTINTNSPHIHCTSWRSRRHVKFYRAKQSLAIECHTIQLPQFSDCMTYALFDAQYLN